jgi:hypothetical protein
VAARRKRAQLSLLYSGGKQAQGFLGLQRL